MEIFASPVLIVMSFALFVWAWAAVGSFSDILDASYNMTNVENKEVSK